MKTTSYSRQANWLIQESTRYRNLKLSKTNGMILSRLRVDLDQSVSVSLLINQAHSGQARREQWLWKANWDETACQVNQSRTIYCPPNDPPDLKVHVFCTPDNSTQPLANPHSSPLRLEMWCTRTPLLQMQLGRRPRSWRGRRPKTSLLKRDLTNFNVSKQSRLSVACIWSTTASIAPSRMSKTSVKSSF